MKFIDTTNQEVHEFSDETVEAVLKDGKYEFFVKASRFKLGTPATLKPYKENSNLKEYELSKDELLSRRFSFSWGKNKISTTSESQLNLLHTRMSLDLNDDNLVEVDLEKTGRIKMDATEFTQMYSAFCKSLKTFREQYREDKQKIKEILNATVEDEPN